MAMKAINKNNFTKKQFNLDLEEIRNSSFFSKVTSTYITVNSKYDLMLKGNSKHSLGSNRILKKKEIFNLGKFTKECVYFIKSKPLSSFEFDNNTNVIADEYVAKRLNISAPRVKQITKGFLKVYQIKVINEHQHNYRKHIQEKYSNNISIGGETFGIFSSGSKLMNKIKFFSYVESKDHGVIKLCKLSSSKKKQYKFHTLEAPSKKDNVKLSNKNTITELNKSLYNSDNYLTNSLDVNHTVLGNELLTNKNLVTFNIVSNDFRKAFRQTIKYLYTARFSNHLNKEYDIKINLSFNKHSIKELLNTLTGIYYSIKGKTDLTIAKFGTLLKTLKNDFFKQDFEEKSKKDMFKLLTQFNKA